MNEPVMLNIGVDEGYVEISLLSEDNESLTLRVDGETARALGETIFKAGCQV